MGTVVRRNERSWAIEIISEINSMLQKLNIKVKRAGGESTLSVNKKSMFPDVLLYADDAQTKVLQGWELKMPDVLITDEAFLADATRKAIALGLNSFVVWNFTYGKLYIRSAGAAFVETRVWTGTNHIKSRLDVTTYKSDWLPIIHEIILTVNEFLLTGEITTSSITEMLSDSLTTALIQRNKDLVADHLITAVSHSMQIESRMKVWWNIFREEYDKDETNMYAAYAKTILLNWTNRILFAHLIKKYHSCANLIQKIDNTSSPAKGNEIIDEIIAQGDFYNVFHKIDFNDMIPKDTWIDIADYNQFLQSIQIEGIDQTVLQDILEKTVNLAKREIRGQYATPYCLANLLCQITVEDWNCDCADFCAGTGTIAKAILNNKMQRLSTAERCFGSTWASDKSAYPLQLANLALTSIEALNIPLNLFQEDVFALELGETLHIKNPADGSEMERKLPPLGAIVSNLPFVKYNSIAADEEAYIKKYSQEIFDNTGIQLKSGKTDLYHYIPFKLHELLMDNGRLGLVLSNSWLGTDVGKQFFDALLYYFKMEAVVMSSCGRWFENADVVATLLVLQKKDISAPDRTEQISFCLLQKELKTLNSSDFSDLVSSIVLKEELDSSIVSLKNYTLEEIDSISEKGICLNALFHDINWIKQIEPALIPIHLKFDMVRGERKGWNDMFYIKGDCGIEKEYLVPMLKSPRTIKNFVAEPDMQAFCCPKTLEDLHRFSHFGAINWIQKFSGLCNEKGVPLPESIHHTKKEAWYQMSAASKADFVTAINPDKRIFVAKLEQQALIDQRLTALALKKCESRKDLVFALLNSLYEMFAVEAIGFGRGLGVLDASKDRFSRIQMIHPDKISEEDEKTIVALFQKIVSRGVMNVDAELEDEAREAFDRKVLSAIGKEELYDSMKKSLLSMQQTRHSVK